MYSKDNDNTEGGWIYFEDGHSEFWNNLRLENELSYRGLQLLKTQTQFSKINLIDNIIARLKTVEQNNPLFPLAGQKYRNKIIEMLQLIKKELEIIGVKK